MIKYMMAATLALVAAQPAAAAQIFDYNVYASGQVRIAGGSYGDIASGSFSDADGKNATNYTSRTTSTAALDSSADALSLQLLGMKPTGTVSTAYGAMTLTGTGSGVNVFNITGTDTASWSNIYALSIGGTGTGAIVNVWGKTLSNFVNLNLGGLAPDKVIFNFHEANTVRMDGMNVRGSILAPEAFVTLQGGSVDGSVITDRFASEGSRIGGNGFSSLVTGGPAPAVPEPATWALMILGFIAIGSAMRRHKQSQGPRIRLPDLESAPST